MDSADTDPPIPSEGNDATAPPAPMFGCVMFALIFALFTGAMVFALIHGGRMYKEIVSFTDEQATAVPFERGSPEELSAIRAKVAAFIEAVAPTEPPPTELTLSARELNVLIANDNYLADVRGRFYIESIEPSDDGGRIRTQASRPRRHIVFWKPERFLNAQIDIRPEAADGQFFLRVADVRVPGRTINEGVLAYMRTEDLLDLYKNDERFEDVVKKISSARIENGSLIVSTASKRPEGAPATPLP